MDLQKLLGVLLAPFDQVANLWTRIQSTIRRFGRQVLLLRIIFGLVLGIAGLYHYIARGLEQLDRLVDRIETAFIFVITFAMTGLVTLHFINTKWNLWELDLICRGSAWLGSQKPCKWKNLYNRYRY